MTNQPLQPTRPGGLKPGAILLIVMYGLSLLLLGSTGDVRVLTHHEVLAAQPAREMLRDGHWLIPTFVGVPRTIKPPTTGWLIAASMTVFQSDAEWVVRLPAILAGVAIALMVAAMAARWFGGTVGLLAGLMQLTCTYSVVQARLAEADMPLTAAVCAAMCLFALANVDSPAPRWKGRWLPWAFYAAAGTAFLLKGPVSIIFVVGGCAMFALTQWAAQRWGGDPKAKSNDARQAQKFLLNPGGLCIYVICLIAWPLASYIAYPQILQDWKQELFGYARGDFGTSPWLYYTYMVPLELLPWALMLIPGAIYGWRRGWARSPLGRFLLCWFLTGLAILSCSKFKSSHYAYPLLPPCVIVAACGLRVWLAWQGQWKPFTRWAYAVVLSNVLLLCCGVGAVVLYQLMPRLPGVVYPVIAVMGMGLVTVLALEYRRRHTAEVIVLLAAAWLVIVGTERYLLPFEDGYAIRADFARRVSAKVPAGQKLFLVGLGENQVVWYLTPPLVRLGDASQLPPPAPPAAPAQTPAGGGKVVYAIAAPAYLETIKPLGNVKILDRVGPTSGWARQEDLALVRLRR